MEVMAIKVNQWLEEWNSVRYDTQFKKKPKPYFYTFSIKASLLKKLSGIQRRKADAVNRATEIGIQRKHDEKRSDEIHEFVHYGYPWSDLSETKKQDPEYISLQKPGWIPTAIVVNILDIEDTRKDHKVDKNDLINIEAYEDNIVKLILPNGCEENNWKPTDYVPIEVIDGQHRLWAFNEDLDFEIPVVAFHGLDISWQAYLFYVINIKPKKIDRSLAFDMYPLLRDEDWLKPTHDYIVYRETRAQELVEILWAYPKSAWHEKIEMLGNSRKFVSQNAWVNSIVATLIKSDKMGGLFSSKIPSLGRPLEWGRSQQAAFIILLWQELKKAVKNNKEEWTKKLRPTVLFESPDDLDGAFYGSSSLLNTDQGVRGVLFIYNDMFFNNVHEFQLDSWTLDLKRHSNIDEFITNVNVALENLKEQPFYSKISELSVILSHFDWRTSKADLSDLNETQMLYKKTFKGSGGYKELRKHLLMHISNSENSYSNTAKRILETLD
ncbi:DGQHR domain-containing protein [bacterium]|nr:DGQHR domain-containing protein [bacterium]MBU1883421.1 DGQHR domain-containing protein [bacterium]